MSNSQNSHGQLIEVTTNTQHVQQGSQELPTTPIQIPKTSRPDISKQQEYQNINYNSKDIEKQSKKQQLEASQNHRFKHESIGDAAPKLPSDLKNIPYADGQRSVEISTEKKVYSKSFLIQLDSKAIYKKNLDVLFGASSLGLNKSVLELDPEIAKQINMKCKNLLLKYEQLQNLDDIIYSLSKDKSSVIRTRHEYFVKSMSLITLDRNLIVKPTVAGKIFAELLSKKIISVMAITQGIDAVLKDWNDYLMDYPQFFSCIAAIITPLLLSQNVPFDFNNLKDSCESIQPENSTDFFLEVLNNILNSNKTQNIDGHLGGILWIYNKWITSEHVSLDMFMPNNQINKYFKNDSIGVFLLSIAIYDKMEQLTDCKLLFDVLHDWIRINISAEIINCPEFVRAITTAVIIAHSKQNDSYDELNHVYKKLLVYYMRSGPYSDLESVEQGVQCLYGAQIIIAALKNPNRMLLRLFHDLYQSGVISSESFESWKKENEPKVGFKEDIETKTTAIEDLKNFFLLLSMREHSSEEDDTYE